MARGSRAAGRPPAPLIGGAFRRASAPAVAGSKQQPIGLVSGQPMREAIPVTIDGPIIEMPSVLGEILAEERPQVGYVVAEFSGTTHEIPSQFRLILRR